MKRKPHFSTDQKEFQQLVSAHAIHVFPFDIEQEQALFGSEKQAELRAQANTVIQKKESADHLKELHLDLSLISCATEKLYFPLYMGTFKYQGQSFEFAIDGKDPDRMKLPIIPQCQETLQTVANFSKARKVFGWSSVLFFTLGVLLLFLALFISEWLPLGRVFRAVIGGIVMSSLPTAVYWVVSGIVLHFLKEQYLKTVQKFRDELKRELLGKKTAGAALLANYEKRGKHLARIRKLSEWLDTLAYVVVIATLIWNIRRFF